MKAFFAILGGLLLIVLLEKADADRRYFDAYDAKTPLNVRVETKSETANGNREKLYVDEVPGEAIPTLLSLPKTAAGPAPCIIFLHGMGQEKEFLDEISPRFNEVGWAIACFDQYTRGERRLPENASMWQQLKGVRQRPAKTVIDTRRLVDYFTTRPDIDPDRIYLVGASFGAITGTTAAALEPRLKAAVLIYGGGNIRHLMSATAVRGEIYKSVGFAPLNWLASDIVTACARYILSPADPARYAGRISPRPVLLQNGTEDVLIANEAARVLQEAVREPKKITIYPGDHIGIDRATVEKALDETLQWLKEQDAALRAQPATV